MACFARRLFALIFPCLFALNVLAQTSAPRAEHPAATSATGTPSVAALPEELFGTIPISTPSDDARKFAELSVEKYENGLLEDAVVHARHATEKDPQFTLGYALLSFVSPRRIPDSSALAKAESLLPHATPDEQLLVS